MTVFIFKLLRFLQRKVIYIVFQWPRVLKFRLLSDCRDIKGRPLRYQPVQINGKGMVEFDINVRLGVNPSPFLYSGYIYIDARKENSKISFGENVWINNNCVFISEGEGITIGENTLIGSSCEIVDSDFHDLHPLKRSGGQVKTAAVIIGKNVFIGSNVKILKGVSIGDNSIIANGSIVTKSIPGSVIVAGIPAKFIRNL
jgi:acetyltransferase-like isoleucine patch superfamily enzyme